jgi:hypothetical protein
VKGVLLVACAFGYGFLRAIPELDSTVLLFAPVLAGLIYFVLHQNDWPAALVPWMLLSMPAGRLAGRWWFSLRGHHVALGGYAEEWICFGLAALCFAYGWWRRVHGEVRKLPSTPAAD